MIVECPEEFNHSSTNGAMSALKPDSSTPYEPKRGQGYAPESLTAGGNASVWGPSLEE